MVIAHRTWTGTIFTDKIIAKAHNNNHQFKLFNKNVNRQATHCERELKNGEEGGSGDTDGDGDDNKRLLYLLIK